MTSHSPLHDRHLELGATMVDFAGWTMPVRYTSEVTEHTAVRTAAGLFDVSHMGEIRVTGPEAAEALDAAVVGQMSAVGVGRAKYTMLVDDFGGVLDDLIVYRLAEDDFLVVANAGNAFAVARMLVERCGTADCVVEDASAATSLIAVQGPAARGIVEAATGLTLADMKYYSVTSGVVAGAVSALIGRTGYTGEDGYELFVASDQAVVVWDTLLRLGVSEGLVPCGLAARDSLRLEAGMPLYGHELSEQSTPYEAGLGWVVALDGGDGSRARFVGDDALADARERVALWWLAPEDAPADARVLVGLVGDGRRAARAGYAVLDGSGRVVGEVTSGSPSPTLGRQIAMAYVHPAVAAEGTELAVDVRGRGEQMTVCALPFYKRQS